MGQRMNRTQAAEPFPFLLLSTSFLPPSLPPASPSWPRVPGCSWSWLRWGHQAQGVWRRSPVPAGSSIPPPQLCPGSGTAAPGCSAAWPHLDETCPGPGMRAGASGWAQSRPRRPTCPGDWPAQPCLLTPSPGSPAPACTEAQPPCTCPACHTELPGCLMLQPPGEGGSENGGSVTQGPARQGLWDLGAAESSGSPHLHPLSLTAGWSFPRVFSRMARASFSR